MNEKLLAQMRTEARNIFEASLKAVKPYDSVRKFLNLEGEILYLRAGEQDRVDFDLREYGRIIIVGGGKATAPMARAVEEILGDRIDLGLVNVKYGFTEELKVTEIREAGHPLPDENGMEGTKKMLALLESAGKMDLVISLISGGGSALLPLPANDISLSEKQDLTRRLLACGASIHEINAVRKHISLSKGGQMARAAFPATVINLMLSDVVGDSMDVIASGPFVPDGSTYGEVRRILEKYELDEIPDSIRRHVQAGLEGLLPETPKDDDPVFDRVYNTVVGSNIIALEAAKAAAEKLGYKALILSSLIEGETSVVACVHSAIAREIVTSGRPISQPACVISGGETTVTIRGNGLGGRNQEFCLSAAIDLDGVDAPVVILSGGTDGNDGPTDAAGAVVDSFSVKRGTEKGLLAHVYLSNNDSYTYFEKTGELLKTGPTNTNVMDVRLVLVRKKE